jgi:large-conductance mechanosensitive channel
MNIKEGINQVTSLRKNISEFINSQNIIGTISGVTIAISAGNTIRSFVNEIIFPILYYIFKTKTKTSEFSPISYEHLSIFGKELMTFLFVLISTFYFVKIVMAQLFDIKQAKTSSNAGGNNSRVGSSVNASDK